MLVSKIIDLDEEFTLLSKLVTDLWQGCDNDSAQNALRMSFEKGLEDAKLWVDEYAVLGIGEALNNNVMDYPLKARCNIAFEGDSTSYLYDALYMFDSNVHHGLSDVYRSVTGYGRWDYSRNVDALCNDIRNIYSDLNVEPKNQNKDTQASIASAYCGYSGSEPGSYPTPEKLLKQYVYFSRDDQGISLFRSLFSTVYSHALYCAKTKNTQTLVNDLLPVYEKRNEPINFDNGLEILNIAQKNRFVAIIHEIHPFKFSSSEEYRMAREQSKKIQAERVKETPEENELRTKELMRSIIDSVTSNLDHKDKKINDIIDAISPKIEGYKLSPIL
jgi:hypothetical protein